MARRRLFSNWVRMRIGRPPSDRADLPIVEKKEELVNRYDNGIDGTNLYSFSQLNEFRTIAQDRDSQYQIYDEMSTDSVIAASLEIYADDATAYDEQGRVIWVESENDEIAKAGNRLLDIFEIPERAWKHIYLACKYGDYYLKLYRKNTPDENSDGTNNISTGTVKIINDKAEYKGTMYTPEYLEYVEDVSDPSTIFDLRKRGKIAGFVEVDGNLPSKTSDNTFYSPITKTYELEDVLLYPPDRLIHIMIGENLTRSEEQLTLNFGDSSATYNVARGKSILYDVYPIQREIQLLEDSLLVNRLTRSSLIRMLEIEVGDMPKKEVNDYLRRIKQLIEQHISLDKTTGDYQSFNAPGPIDNVIYIPVKNGRGHVSINNLGGDVNVKDIADVDYFNNKRAGALKIPKQFLGEGEGESSLGNGGSLTQMSIRYARTIKRIQTAYIRAITQLLNLFFIDKKLDYVNKFQVKMTSPSTQEDLDRVNKIESNVTLSSDILDLVNSLEGSTQKKVLTWLLANVINMPEISAIVEKDGTAEEDIDIEGGGGGGFNIPRSGGASEPTFDFSVESDTSETPTEPSTSAEPEGNTTFTDNEYSSFEDNI